VWTEQHVDELVGHLLRVGVITAAVVVFVGGVMYLVRHGTELPDYRLYRGEPASLRGLGGIITEARGLHGRGVIQLGLLVLVATPVARVALSVFAFVRLHNGLYVVVTLLVLAVLLYSLVYGS